MQGEAQAAKRQRNEPAVEQTVDDNSDVEIIMMALVAHSEKPTFIHVIGAPGSGKTTLLRKVQADLEILEMQQFLCRQRSSFEFCTSGSIAILGHWTGHHMDGMDCGRRPQRYGRKDMSTFVEEAAAKGLKLIMCDGFRVMKTEVVEAALEHTKTILIHLTTPNAYVQCQKRRTDVGEEPIPEYRHKNYDDMARRFARRYNYQDCTFEEALQRIRNTMLVKQEGDEALQQSSYIDVKLEPPEDADGAADVFRTTGDVGVAAASNRETEDVESTAPRADGTIRSTLMERLMAKKKVEVSSKDSALSIEVAQSASIADQASQDSSDKVAEENAEAAAAAAKAATEKLLSCAFGTQTDVGDVFPRGPPGTQVGMKFILGPIGDHQGSFCGQSGSNGIIQVSGKYGVSVFSDSGIHQNCRESIHMHSPHLFGWIVFPFAQYIYFTECDSTSFDSFEQYKLGILTNSKRIKYVINSSIDPLWNSLYNVICLYSAHKS